MSRVALWIMGLCLLWPASRHLAAEDDPLAAATLQAAVLEAAPSLSSGHLDLDAGSLGEGAFVWLAVEQDGLYTVSLSVPGSLVLGSFPNADGTYDGQTRPVRHATSASLQEPPRLGPLLLTSTFPYLLSAGSTAGAGRLELKLEEAAPELSEPPERGTAVLEGDALYASENHIDLVLEGSETTRRIELIAEPRAALEAKLGRRPVPVGGWYPWRWPEDAPLVFRDTSRNPSPPARIWVRVQPEPIALDETEPNHSVPNPLMPGQRFRGHLLSGDEDRLVFTLDEPETLALTIEAAPDSARFTATLSATDGATESLLWSRKPGSHVLDNESLTLAPGQYRLDLRRADGGTVPAPYSLRLNAGAPPGANQEIEPNDNRQAAMPLPDSYRVSGHAGNGDLDVYRFTVPADKAEHLWRVFTVDATRLTLHDRETGLADLRPTGRRSMLDALALSPGDYWVTIAADGDYLLRVIDQGPRPSDYEGEPNDSFNDGQRLEFGKPIRGGFHREGDLDYYLFRLDAPSPVEVFVRPAGDGPMDAKLYLGSGQVGQTVAFEPGDGPYTFRAELTAGDWALVLRALDPSIQQNYEVGVSRQPALADGQVDDQPQDAVKMPGDGDIASTVGGFDGKDQVFVALPEGEGSAVIACRQDRAGRVGRWAIYDWSEGRNLSNLTNGMVVFDYGPELGGAVRLGLDGANREVGYSCAMRFPPLQTAGAGQPAETAEAGSGQLEAGETRRLTITETGPEPVLALGLEEGESGFVTCRTGDGQALTPDLRVWRLEGVTQPVRAQLGALTPFVAGPEPRLVLSRSYAQRRPDGTLPLDVDCSLYGLDDLPRPSDMGPPAPFRLMARNEAGVIQDAGPPPPGLEALLARETPTRQPEGDLPVVVEIADLPELAAFVSAGQKFEVSARLVSEAPEPLEVRIAFDIDSEGWRIRPDGTTLNLSPGEPVNVTAEVEAPPRLLPALQPGVSIRVSSGASFASAIAGIPLSASAAPLAPFTHWQAPEALRGGLNVLHYGLGARLIDWGGTELTERQQWSKSAVHDGLAPHIQAINVPKDIAFRLAASAEIAGVMIQSRSTTSPERWPADVTVYAPDGDTGWRRVAAALLETVYAPQYVVFETPVSTDRLRFTFDSCHAPCKQVYLQDIQAIAVPGRHPEGLPPINAANLALGGHVVWGNHRFGGAWNTHLLEADPGKGNRGWYSGSKPRDLQATIAFHHNRAALLQSVDWVADPDDQDRTEQGVVEASLESPAGPWTRLGYLRAPEQGEQRSRLVFDEPVWARYLRLTFTLGGESGVLGPDAIEAIEVPGTSVLGLWEDDQPRAAWEAANDIREVTPVPPIGGHDRASAVALPIGTTIESSVVIERNEDWWRIDVGEGGPQRLQLTFGQSRPVVVAELFDSDGQAMILESDRGEQVLETVLGPGSYHLRIYEPPRSVVISWDTSGSVATYIPRTLAAVRTWGRSLQPGRDALQLLPFGPGGFLLEDWAETPEALEPALAHLPEEESSASEEAMETAAKALAERRGARGIVIMTDAETAINHNLWPALIQTMPRVVSLSVDSDSAQNAAVMMDWASLNGGHFQRVTGPLGLADSLEMANALFRAPKAYRLTASMAPYTEPEGEARLTISVDEAAVTASTGAVELILDASGSMLQRMDGRRRIEIAHDALTGLVRDTLPEGMPFAFRAFGLEEDACRTELRVPLAPLDRKAAERAIRAVPAVNLAKTAIADSLREAAGDLAEASAPRVVVLVTDGEETCDGDPEAAIAELRAQGLDARVNIVGFAIDDAELARTFSSWAQAGGGSYFDAGSATALEQSIKDALRVRFDVIRTWYDGRQEVVARAALGETVTVPAGRLTIAPGSNAVGEAVSLTAAPDASINLSYAAGGAGLKQPISDANDLNRSR